MNLKQFLGSIRRYWQIFVVVAGVVFALCLAVLVLTPTKYVSRTQLMVSIAGSTTAAAYQNDEVVTGRVNSYIALLTSDVVNQRVIDRLGLSLTAPELAAKVSATNVPPKTTVIDVAVTDDSPAQARLLADTLATEFISYTDALETPTGEDAQKVHTTVVTTASEPRGQRAERVLFGALAAVAALLMGAVAVWIRTRTDPVVRTADRAAAAAGVPVVGHVTSAPAAGDDALDGYRRLRTRLRSIAGPTGEAGERGRVWVVTSAAGEVDTAVIAANLARAMELAGSRTTVLDTGSQEAMVANDEVEDEDASTEPSLSVHTWARDPDLAASDATAGLFDRLRNEYAHVIVAAPPVLATTTASVVSEYADGVLLVLSLGTTRRADLGRAATDLRATGAPLAGAVISDTTPAPEIVSGNDGRSQSDTAEKAHTLTSEVIVTAPAKPSDHSVTKER